MQRAAAIAVSVLSLAFLPQHARAQGFAGVALNTCQAAVGDHVKGIHPDASDFNYANAKTAQDDMKTNVNGKGQFDSGQGKKSFTYSCVYNIQSGDASDVHVTISGATAAN